MEKLFTGHIEKIVLVIEAVLGLAILKFIPCKIFSEVKKYFIRY